jgi:hypothetical protein
MNRKKKYFHELLSEEVLNIISCNYNFSYISDNFIQPSWCKMPGALSENGCWSLTDLREKGNRHKISKKFCKLCEYYEKDNL